MSEIHIQQNVPLAPLSTFGIGGKAKWFIEVNSANMLVEAIKYAQVKSLPFKLFAGGSNVVFPDEGFNYLVIHLKGGEIKRSDDVFTVDGGVLLNQVITKSITLGLSGLESLSGIPGTVGGAIVGNAGAYGHSISEVILRVKVFDGDTVFLLSAKDCQFHYRDSILKHKKLFLLEAQLQFQKGNAKELMKRSQEIIILREQKYKPGLKCPGSFFKNVLVADLSAEVLSRIDKKWIKYGKIPAGYLLEQVGAKGMKWGGVEVADYHGNLLLNNDGNGKASEVKELAQKLKNLVKNRFEIELEEEVRYF